MTGSWPTRHTYLALFVACFCILAVKPEAAPFSYGIPEAGETVRVARSLAFHGTFADPFVAGRTGLTAHVAPVYPLLLAGYIRLVGTGHGAQLLLTALTIVIFAVQLTLLPYLGRIFGLSMTPGIIAALLGAVTAHEALDGAWECYLVGLLLVLSLVVAAKARFGEQAAAAGWVWGITVLAQPVTVLLMLAWPWVLRHYDLLRKIIMWTAAVMIITPWIARDHVRFGTWMFVRDNLGLELRVANNPCASADYKSAELSGCFHRYHPNSNPEVARQVASLGEAAFNREQLRQAVAWIRGNPGTFARLTAQRMRQFWFPTLQRRWEEPGVWLVTALAFCGLILLHRDHARLAGVIAMTWVCYPLVYYVLVAEPRYAYPIVWTLLLPAGVAVEWAINRWKMVISEPRMNMPDASGMLPPV